MIRKILWRSFKFLMLLLLSLAVLMAIPRIISALRPGKPPVGYYWVPPTYLALGIGLEKMINKTPDIPSNIQEIKDIEYKNINGKSLRLDMYVPKNVKKPAPLIIFIHGGGWKGGKRSDYLVYLVAYAKKGYITATVSYRLLEDAPYPASAEDIRDAMNWFFSHGDQYGYNPDNIAVVGGSAGGHLGLLGAYQWKEPGQVQDSLGLANSRHRIKAVVDIYGPVDLTTEYARNHPLVTNYLAHPYSKAPDIYREASPLQYADKTDPPTLILHGTMDDLVPISQSVLLKNRLDSLGVPCYYRPVPGWPHTMDLVQRVNDYCQKEMDIFFSRYLK